MVENGNESSNTARCKQEEGVSRRFVAKNLSQVFGSLNDQKIPRQARPIIQRKDQGSYSPPGGDVSPDFTVGLNQGGNEFRERTQTAPILRRQRKVHMENNNTEDSLDEIGPTIEMPKPHQETKKGQKHRFPFKKNREKDDQKGRTASRRIRGDGQLTPSRGGVGVEYNSQNNNGETTTLRARSASTSTTERRRRTRRRRGNRKSGSNTGLDNEQIEKMSLEEALNVLQSGSREGQTWQQSENLQCQVINGTTYFTPVGNYKTKDSEEPMSAPPAPAYDYDEYGKGNWSPGSSNGEKANATNTTTMENNNTATPYDGGDTGTLFPEFKPRVFNKFTQQCKSEPMQRRSVKTGAQWNADYGESDMTELKSKMSEFKSLWMANESKQRQQQQEAEQMAANTAEEAATMALIEGTSATTADKEKTKIDKYKININKLWESKNANPVDMWEVEKPLSTRVSPTCEESIWSPPVSDFSSLRISHQHLGIEAPGSDSQPDKGIWSPIGNWNPIAS